MWYAVVFSVFIQWVTSEPMLLAPLQRCVPTTTVRGPCHVCVCSAEGVFHCRAELCKDQEMVQNIPQAKECEPDMMYRETSIFCRCSDNGFWLSDDCRKTFNYIRPKGFTMRAKASINLPCTRDTLYLLDCNICLCKDKGFIDLSSCTNRRCAPGHKADKCEAGDFLRMKNELCTCSDINYYVDHLCIKTYNRTVQTINRTSILNLIDIGKEWEDLSTVQKRFQSSCEKGSQYVVDCNKCICVQKGTLNCTKNTCKTDEITLRNGYELEKNQFNALPELGSEHNKCIPGQKYRYKCNTCTCSAKGEASCTTMICLEEFVMDMTELLTSK